MATKIGVIAMVIGVGIATTIQIACLDKDQRKKYLTWAWLSWAFTIGGACAILFSAP